MTSRLWDLHTSAPYGHRGDFTTLDEVVRAHGGAAARATDAYEAMAPQQQASLITFLKSLGRREAQP